MKNNMLFFLGPLNTLGGLTDESSVLGVVSQFNVVVLAQPQDPAEAKFLRSVLSGYRVSNPKGRVFGYTSLGNALDLDSWKLSADDWLTGYEKLIAGVFIDDFGFDFAIGDRANQNEAIDYVHVAELAVAVRARNHFDVFDPFLDRENPTSTKLGLHATLTDVVVLSDFFQKNENSLQPTVVRAESVVGSLQYTKEIRDEVTPPPKLEFAVLVGAGLQNDVSLKNVWQPAFNAAAKFGVEHFGVVPYDEGLDSGSYFLRNIANQFVYE